MQRINSLSFVCTVEDKQNSNQETSTNGTSNAEVGTGVREERHSEVYACLQRCVPSQEGPTSSLVQTF